MGEELKATDADRDVVVERLEDAWAQGQLTSEERDARIEQALRGRTLVEIDALLRDLQTDQLDRPLIGSAPDLTPRPTPPVVHPPVRVDPPVARPVGFGGGSGGGNGGLVAALAGIIGLVVCGVVGVTMFRSLGDDSFGQDPFGVEWQDDGLGEMGDSFDPDVLVADSDVAEPDSYLLDAAHWRTFRSTYAQLFGTTRVAGLRLGTSAVTVKLPEGTLTHGTPGSIWSWDGETWSAGGTLKDRGSGTADLDDFAFKRIEEATVNATELLANDLATEDWGEATTDRVVLDFSTGTPRLRVEVSDGVGSTGYLVLDLAGRVLERHEIQ